MPLVLPFPDIDPVLFSFHLFGLELAIRWYALAYIAGLLLGWRYVAGLCRRPALWGGRPPMRPRAGGRPADLDDPRRDPRRPARLRPLLPAGLLRRQPAEILAVWHGGMSFHGGFLGVVAGVVGFSLQQRPPILGVGDAVAAAAPIGLFFGRIANFINAELWGRPSTAPWAVIFPGEAAQTCPPDWVGPCARHPSQLYEAALEGLAALRRPCAGDPARRAGAPGPGVRPLPHRLCAGADRRRGFRQADAQFVTPDNPHGHVLASARARPDDGPAPVAADAGRRPRSSSLWRGARRVTRARAPLIRARIAARGPMQLDAYMALCARPSGARLLRDARSLRRAGDFVTAPEISQMFGELVGAWAAQVWADQGRPEPFVLAELGPGRGTLMRDALRVAAGDAGLPRRGAALAGRDQPGAARAPGRGARGGGADWADRVEALPEGRCSSSPTSSSTRCRSASSSAPTRSGASGWSAVDGGRLAFRWGAAAAGRRPRRPASRSCRRRGRRG